MVSDSARQEDFILDNGLVKNVPPRGHCVLGIDLAQSSDFTVLYGARSHDRKNIFFERFNEVAWSEQKRRIRRAVRTLKARWASEVTLCIDEGNAGATLLMTDAAPADPVYNDGEPWDDLVDDDEETTAVLLEAMRRPTPNELMANPEVWQRYVP
jgi:hypothetical protein